MAKFQYNFYLFMVVSLAAGSLLSIGFSIKRALFSAVGASALLNRYFICGYFIGATNAVLGFIFIQFLCRLCFWYWVFVLF